MQLDEKIELLIGHKNVENGWRKYISRHFSIFLSP